LALVALVRLVATIVQPLAQHQQKVALAVVIMLQDKTAALAAAVVVTRLEEPELLDKAIMAALVVRLLELVVAALVRLVVMVLALLAAMAEMVLPIQLLDHQ
jgi:hypothetical protein